MTAIAADPSAVFRDLLLLVHQREAVRMLFRGPRLASLARAVTLEQLTARVDRDTLSGVLHLELGPNERELLVVASGTRRGQKPIAPELDVEAFPGGVIFEGEPTVSRIDPGEELRVDAPAVAGAGFRDHDGPVCHGDLIAPVLARAGDALLLVILDLLPGPRTERPGALEQGRWPEGLGDSWKVTLACAVIAVQILASGNKASTAPRHRLALASL